MGAPMIITRAGGTVRPASEGGDKTAAFAAILAAYLKKHPEERETLYRGNGGEK
ncbi:MAG: hypothetical protein V8S72_05025 [Oscillospiraceae bacterium]